MKKPIGLFLLLIFLVTSTGVIGAHHNRLPGNSWTSGQQVQNIGQIQTTVQLVAYNPFGGEFNCDMRQLLPGESTTFLSENPCTTIPDEKMPEGFFGSGVVRADQPLAAIVNVNNSPFGPAAGQYVGTSVQDVSTSIVFPLVKNNHVGRTTAFLVQNTSSSLNNVTAVFKVNGGTYTVDFDNVPPKSMVIITPGDVAGMPSGTGAVGSLTVTGTQTLAGSSLEHETLSSGEPVNLQASRAFVPSDYDSTLYCPLARRNHGPLNATTGLQVMNVGGGPETIQVIYKVIAPVPRTVGPIVASNVPDGASANFLASDHLNPGELASITVTASGDGDLAAITNDRADGPTPRRFTTYSCFSDSNATNTINLPLVKEDFYNNTTGIQVQNVCVILPQKSG